LLSERGGVAGAHLATDVGSAADAYRSDPSSDNLLHLLTSWFNRGFLKLQRIDWRSSAAVLQKLIEYEAVHQIQGWHDLRRRLEADRRCYAFFHSALAEEPLIFIEVALTRGMSGRVQPLLDPNSPVNDPRAADSAIFYSITNCQEGLRGVPFGSLLIKQVVDYLKKSLPRIRTFATLSPIPGSRKWLAGAYSNLDTGELGVQMRRRLVPLCAHYLVHEKRGQEPLDSVARFHLKNSLRGRGFGAKSRVVRAVRPGCLLSACPGPG
jgi:malonyl-CoA decarboxylase